MKQIAVSEIKDLRPVIRGLVSATLNDITSQADYKSITPFKQTLSIEGHLVTASYTPIFSSDLDGDVPEHTCGRSKRVGLLDLSCATEVPYQINFQEDDFGKPVPEEIIDSLTDGYINYLTLAACDSYLISSGISQDINDAVSNGDFGVLEAQAGGLIEVSYSENSHHIEYKSPTGEMRFKMEYDDGVMLHNLDPQFHVQAVAGNYARCLLDAMANGFIMADLTVNLGDKSLFQPK